MTFQEMGRLDAEHRAYMGTLPKASTARASVLCERLMRLDRITPVLRSRYLVKGWLDRGASSVVYAESNAGKTFLAMDLALHVAAGVDWHGARIKEPQEVVYIAAEGGSGLRNRVEAVRQHNPDLAAAAAPNFHLLPDGLDLCTANDAHDLADALACHGIRPGLIVIDTLARTMGNGDENAAKDMGLFIRSIDTLRTETGAHVMVIHHSGKDASKGARGSGSLRAAVDTEIELTRAEGVVTAETRKQRDMPCDAVFAFTLLSVFLDHDEDGDRVTSAVVEQTDIQRTDKRRRLSGRAQVAIEALKEVIADKGRIIQSPNLPNVPVVDLDAWRTACDRVGLTDSDNPQTQARIFRRHRDTLMDKDRIRIWESYVWLADKADRQRTPADKSAAQADGHGHPPIRGVPCPATSSTSDPRKHSPADNPLPQAGARISLPDPDAFDPEMWR